MEFQIPSDWPPERVQELFAALRAGRLPDGLSPA
jgi:hypothetical protein